MGFDAPVPPPAHPTLAAATAGTDLQPGSDAYRKAAKEAAQLRDLVDGYEQLRAARQEVGWAEASATRRAHPRQQSASPGPHPA
jgi:hypothetical protein